MREVKKDFNLYIVSVLYSQKVHELATYLNLLKFNNSLHHLISHIGQNYSRLTDQYLKKARIKDTYAKVQNSMAIYTLSFLHQQQVASTTISLKYISDSVEFFGFLILAVR